MQRRLLKEHILQTPFFARVVVVVIMVSLHSHEWVKTRELTIKNGAKTHRNPHLLEHHGESCTPMSFLVSRQQCWGHSCDQVATLHKSNKKSTRNLSEKKLWKKLQSGRRASRSVGQRYDGLLVRHCNCFHKPLNKSLDRNGLFILIPIACEEILRGLPECCCFSFTEVQCYLNAEHVETPLSVEKETRGVARCLEHGGNLTQSLVKRWYMQLKYPFVVIPSKIRLTFS